MEAGRPTETRVPITILSPSEGQWFGKNETIEIIWRDGVPRFRLELESEECRDSEVPILVETPTLNTRVEFSTSQLDTSCPGLWTITITDIINQKTKTTFNYDPEHELGPPPSPPDGPPPSPREGSP